MVKSQALLRLCGMERKRLRAAGRAAHDELGALPANRGECRALLGAATISDVRRATGKGRARLQPAGRSTAVGKRTLNVDAHVWSADPKAPAHTPHEKKFRLEARTRVDPRPDRPLRVAGARV